MAGSEEFQQELSAAERNRLTRERIGNDPEQLAERISIVDRDKYDFDGYSDKEINMALQGDMFGDDDYSRLTGNPIAKDEPKDPPVVTPEPDRKAPTPDPVQEMPTPDEPPAIVIPGPGPGIPGGQYQNVVQDNDINTSITGDGNTVSNNQNNSVRQYGGSSFLSDWMREHSFFK